jgi:hypothetical protein
MYGSTMGTLALEQTTNGVDWTTLWTKSGDQGDSWQHAIANASSYVLQVRFAGTAGTSYTSDMAIDDVGLFPDSACHLPTPSPTRTFSPTEAPTSVPTALPTSSPTPTPTITPSPTSSLSFTSTGPCILTDHDSCVSSGNYPSSYSNYESCTITPSGNGLLSVVSFSTEGYFDRLSIDIDGDGANDATYSGYNSAGPDGVQVSSSTTMSWYSDGSVLYPGW